MSGTACESHNLGGRRRVVVTKPLPGERWLEMLVAAGCRVEVCGSTRPLSAADVTAVMEPAPATA